MRARVVLPSVVLAAVVTAGGFWASAASRPHHGAVSGTTVGQRLGTIAALPGETSSAPTPTARPKPRSAPPVKARSTPAHPGTPGQAPPPASSYPRTNQPAPPPPAAPPAPAPAPGSSPTSVDLAVFNLLNSERARYHLPALRWSPQLFCSAAEHTALMDRYSSLQHDFPGEPDFSARTSACGFHGSMTAENIGMSYDTSEAGALALQDYMVTEPHPPCPPPSQGGCETGHKRNILSPNVTSVGVSVIIDQRTGELWLAENFGG